MSVTAEQLGLPADRAWIHAPRPGPYLPGEAIELVAGIHHGVAAPRREFSFELHGPGGVAARQQLTRTVLRPSEPIVLSLKVPATPGIEYELVLRAGDQTVSWPVRVPEKPLDARWEVETPLVRRGEALSTLLHTGELELLTGADYWVERLDGETWSRVPWREDRVWAAVGIGRAAHSTTRERFELPEDITPGQHRVCKHFTVEDADIDHVTFHAEFTVR